MAPVQIAKGLRDLLDLLHVPFLYYANIIDQSKGIFTCARALSRQISSYYGWRMLNLEPFWPFTSL
jgi:hypothetical protein